MYKTCTRAELTKECDKNCLVAKEDRKWWYFLATSGAIFFGGLLIILVSRLVIRICNAKRTRLNPSKKDAQKQRVNHAPHASPDVSKRGIYVWLKEQAGTLITAQTLKGRCLVSEFVVRLDRKCRYKLVPDLLTGTVYITLLKKTREFLSFVKPFAPNEWIFY